MFLGVREDRLIDRRSLLHSEQTVFAGHILTDDRADQQIRQIVLFSVR